MTGIEVFRKLKELSPDILGIIITGSEDEHSAVEALKLGVLRLHCERNSSEPPSHVTDGDRECI